MLKKFKKNKNINPFYIRGFQRSGTNWACNLCNLHPDINCTGEFHFEELFEGFNKTINKNHGLLSRKPTAFTAQYYNFIENTIRHYSKNHIVCGDRTPTSLYSCYIPNRKYILIQRDGRDALVSWLYHLFRMDHKFGPYTEEKKLKFQKDQNYFEVNKKELLNNHWVKKIAKNWSNRVNYDLKFIKEVEAKSIKAEVMFIKYEELLLDTENIRNELYNFLDCSPDKAKGLNKLTSASFKKHDPNSHYRYGKAGRWKEYFTTPQLKLFNTVANSGLDLHKQAKTRIIRS